MPKWSDRFVYDTEYDTRPVPPDPLIPLNEMVRRIEAVRDTDIRAEQHPKRCGSCGALALEEGGAS